MINDTKYWKITCTNQFATIVEKEILKGIDNI